MPKYIPDISTRRWVIVASNRLSRPRETADGRKKKFTCPFCEGNEKMTPPEITRIGSGKPNQPGWLVRVIPNKYPITEFHEVIIHTPRCQEELEEMKNDHLEKIFHVYKSRYNFFRDRGQVIIFTNSRRHAGASLSHSHSQLVVIPFQINLDTLAREPISNLVMENKYFVVYCPDFSQWPFEYWIAPKTEGSYFGDMKDDEIDELVSVLKRMLIILKKIFVSFEFSEIPFAYNFYIYPGKNWYIRIIPRFVHRAGFELATGVSVNIIDPTEAAKEFKRLVNL
ncbi:MAG: DUF4931 domain-containing protein [Patescibacteria group bacterium]|nr:DUF4931 domain-containing protein [Patescibacteria group bacterium]